MSLNLDILMVVSCPNGRMSSDVYDLIAFGRHVLALQNGTMRMLMVGDRVARLAEEVARCEGIDVMALENPAFATYTNEAYRKLLVGEIASLAPSLVCTMHNSQGWEWAPAVAAAIGAACISAVDGVLMKADQLHFQKDLYGGKVKGHFAATRPVATITVQPGCFKYTPMEATPPGGVTLRRLSWAPEKTRYLGVKKAQADTSRITDANVVVAVGNGIGSDENLPLVEDFAKLFDRSAVAGTRIVCDRGWLGYHQQVGVTGATVAPSLYIACGISGAAQHVMGMRGSGLVVAINTDARAPMLAEADLCVVEDLTQFLSVVLDVFAQQNASD